jgi:hypothetical protein
MFCAAVYTVHMFLHIRKSLDYPTFSQRKNEESVVPSSQLELALINSSWLEETSWSRQKYRELNELFLKRN